MQGERHGRKTHSTILKNELNFKERNQTLEDRNCYSEVITISRFWVRSILVNFTKSVLLQQKSLSKLI